MRPRRTVSAIVAAAGIALAVPGLAAATDLVDAWRAAERHDVSLASARAARVAGEARRAQAGALWRPSVQLSGTAGLANAETRTRGAQFATPAFGTSNEVAFNTSITGGTTERLQVAARQPLVSGERDAQARSLLLAADAATVELEGARQAAMVRVAERYLEVVGVDESLRVLRRQQDAVERMLVEARDRFRLGDIPVTATHEAAARAEAIRAQVIALEADLAVRIAGLADLTGFTPDAARLARPARDVVPAAGETLDGWLAAAVETNPQLRAQVLAAEMARAEADRHSLKAGTSVDVVAQWSRDHIAGTGDFGQASATATNALVGVQVVVPLYTGGYRSAKQAEALGLAVKARTDADVIRQRIALGMRSAWLGLAAGARRVVALEESRRASLARLDATRVGGQVGDRTTLDVLNAENDAAAAELALVQARIGLVLDRLRLTSLAGRLDESALASINATLALPVQP